MSIDNTTIEALNELRSTVESKHADSAEMKGKVEKLEAKIGDDEAARQKDVAEAKAKQDEQDKRLVALQESYDSLYKKANRVGVAAAEDDAKAVFKGYSRHLSKFLRRGTIPGSEEIEAVCRKFVEETLDADEDVLVNEAKTLVTGSNPDGGYLVFPDRRTDFQVNRIFETSPMRSVSRIITTTSNEVEVLINDNEFASGGWVGELETRPETNTAQFGQLTIPTHEQFAQPAVSQKMLDDASINVEQLVSDQIRDIMTRTENTAFVVGDGSQKPKGFLAMPESADPDVYERGTIGRLDSGVAGEITADKVIELTSLLKQAYTPNAVWMMKRATWNNVLTLKDGQGRYLLDPTVLPNEVALRLRGYPVFFADDMPAIATDSESIALGDFGVGYTIVDRLGIRVIRDNLTAKPKVLFYTTKRVGGAVTNYEAIKVLKLSA